MKKNPVCLAGVVLALVASPALAIDTSEPLLCATLQVDECIDGQGCKAVLHEEVNAPTFVRIDLGKKTLATSTRATPTAIESVRQIGSRVILQGAAEVGEDKPEPRGWTLALEADTGRFVATVTITQGAIILFGACTEI